MTPTARRQLGDSGEGHARRFLEARGYRFVVANWRCSAGEVDLVMRDGDEVVFVEVKTRRGERAGRAEDAVSSAQAARLLSTAAWFVAERPEFDALIWRVDLIAITLAADGRVARVNHVQNAITGG